MVSGKSNGVLANSFSLLGRFIVILLICNFICLSYRAVAVSAFTDVLGYDAYGYQSDDPNDAKLLYRHYNDDGQDEKAADYEKKGYTIQKRTIRGEIVPTGRVVYLVIAQISCLVTLYAFIYPPLWKCGDRDGAAVRFGRQKHDRFKGFKISLITFGLMLAVYLIFELLGSKSSTAAYTLFNSHLYSFLILLYGGADSFAQLSLWRHILIAALTLTVPVLAQVAYTLGFNEISVSRNIIYKRNGDA